MMMPPAAREKNHRSVVCMGEEEEEGQKALWSGRGLEADCSCGMVESSQ